MADAAISKEISKEQAKAVKEARTEHELGTMLMVPLFSKYSLASLVGMLFQAVMVVFEGIIIGNGLGEDGLAQVGIIMPLEYVQLAIGYMMATGVAALAAMKLGAGDEEGARRAYGQGVWFSLLVICIVAVLGIIFADPLANLLGCPAMYKDTVVPFIRVFMCFYPLEILGWVVYYMARVAEVPILGTIIAAVSAILALAWLYLGVYVFKTGFFGTAFYYGSSIGLWFFGIFYFIFSKKTLFKCHMSDWHFDKEIIGGIVKLGLPAFLVQVSTTIFGIVMNNFIVAFSATPDAATANLATYSILNGYVIYLLQMFVQAAQGAVNAISAFNYGAKSYQRVGQLVKSSMIITTIVVYLLVIITEFFAGPILGVFGGDATMVGPTQIVIFFSALGFTSSIMSTYFESVGKIIESTILGIIRYIVFGIPAVLIIGNMMGILGVWYAQPVADVLTFVLTIVLTVVELRRLKRMQAQLPGHDQAALA